MTPEELNARLIDQINRLQLEIRDLLNWKNSAMAVLTEWDQVWEAAGKPGKLGRSKAVSTLEYLKSLPTESNLLNWTTDRPKGEGFYWYRDPGRPPEVIFWDYEMQWVRIAGSEIPWGDDMQDKIEGEFWPEKLITPKA